MSLPIQSAAENALSTFLASKMPTFNVISGWPSPSKQIPDKTVSIVTSGPRRDTPIEQRLIKSTNNGDKRIDAVWQIAACMQPFQIDIWTHSDFVRDQIMSEMDIYLNYGASGLGTGNYDIGNGVLLNLQDGWADYDTKGDFFFDEPATHDNPESNHVKSFRATYNGTAHIMLAVPSNTPRQLLINFSMFLDGDTVATTYNTDL